MVNLQEPNIYLKSSLKGKLYEMDYQSDNFYEVIKTDENNCTLTFYSFYYEENNNDPYLKKMWTISGPSVKHFKEGRHSDFGDDGYIYYFNKEYF